MNGEEIKRKQIKAIYEIEWLKGEPIEIISTHMENLGSINFYWFHDGISDLYYAKYKKNKDFNIDKRTLKKVL